MWISRSLFVLILQLYYSSALLDVKHDHNNTLAACIKSLVQLNYKDTSLTFVQLNARNSDILQALHETNSLSIITRKPYVKITLPHRGYLIYTLTAADFFAQFLYLLKEDSWMPYAPFLVVVERLTAGQLRPMFEELLRVHVFNVVIIDASTANIYTYRPLENGCGKNFDKIIKLGECLTDNLPDLYPNTTLNNLRNCTLRVAATHWPPYTIDAKQSNVTTMGLDEYIFYLLGELEHVNVNFTYDADLCDMFSSVNEDMEASGPLRWLQDNKFDAVTGCQMLMPDRAVAFTYLSQHIAFDEYFTIFVQQAGPESGWKLLVRVFKPLVWLLLLLTFIAVVIIILLISKTKDRWHVVFTLIDNLLMHDCRIRRISELYFILLFWIIFACLIAYHYLSVLTSLTTKPISQYQIDEESDLIENDIQPWVSDVIRGMQTLVSPTPAIDAAAAQTPRGLTLSHSLRSVATSDNLYTVVPYSLYFANRYKYYNKYGERQLHSFRKPLGQVIYASYLYKGFPLYDKINLLIMKSNAAGIPNKIWDDYQYTQKIDYEKKQIKREKKITVPWYIIALGSGCSSLCFVGELLTNHFNKSRRNSPVKVNEK